MRRAVIVAAGGDAPPHSKRHQYIKDLLRPDDFLVAVNGGSCIVLGLGLTPQLVIGDLDSLTAGSIEKIAWPDDSSPQVLSFPSDKDMTDTELAVRHLLEGESPPREIVICGALGGRLDHELALLFYAASVSTDRQSQAQITLTDGRQKAFFINGKASIDGRRGQTVSFVPLTQKVTGLYLQGFAYPLRGGVLRWGQTLGVSNVLTEPPGKVEIRGEGMLVAVIHTGAVGEQ